MAMLYGSTKTYTHAQGLSCAFRQWRAKSHCRFIHGYALQVTLDFQAGKEDLDENGWVVDFGGLKDIKWWLEKTFDHRLLVAENDPEKERLLSLDLVPPDGGSQTAIAQVVVIPEVGCENFARYIWDYVQGWLVAKDLNERVVLHKVTVAEHGGNSAYVEVGYT